jgi:hypothetical protein
MYRYSRYKRHFERLEIWSSCKFSSISGYIINESGFETVHTLKYNHGGFITLRI